MLSPEEWDRRLLWLAAQISDKSSALDGNRIAGRQEASVGSLPTDRVGNLHEERDRFVVAALLEKDEGRLRVATVSWPKPDLHRGVVSVSEIGVTISGQQLAGVEEGEHAGSALSAAGDLSDDNQNDMLVGAPDNDAVTATDDNAGAIYLVLDSDPAVNDGDADGVLDALDCDPANNQVWAQPGEVSGMTLTHDPVLRQTEVTWTAPGDLGGTAVRYDTIRSTIPDDFVFSAVCVESDDGADTMAIDSDMLPEGVAAYYLVRAQNDCPDGLGGVGEDTEGLLRIAIDCP